MAREGWRDVLLGDVAEGLTVGYVGPMASEYVSSGVPFLRSQNVEPLRVIDADLKFITPSFHSRLRKSALSPGDVVIVRTGKPGACAVIPRWLPVANCSDLVIVRCGSQLDSRFLAYYINSVAAPHVDSHLVGAVQQHFNVGSARQIVMHLPGIAEQRAIADILSTLDDKIDFNQRMTETLEAIARALFKSWFVDFDPVRAKAAGRDPGLQKIARFFPGSFEDSELGKIPTGWKVASLGQLYPDDADCVLTGPFGTNLHAHDYRAEGVPLILVKHVVNGQILDDGLPLVGVHRLGDLERYRLRFGDIVFTRVGAVGRSAYVRDRNAGWLISGQLLRVRLRDWGLVHPRYLAQRYLEKTFTDMVEGHALGTTRPSLNTQLLRGFRFAVPPSGLTHVFADKISSLDERVQANRDQSRTLVALRDTLLPKVLSGEIRVRDAEGLAETALS